MHRGGNVEPDGNIIRFGSPVHDEAAEQSGSLHREEPRVKRHLRSFVWVSGDSDASGWV